MLGVIIGLLLAPFIIVFMLLIGLIICNPVILGWLLVTIIVSIIFFGGDD